MIVVTILYIIVGIIIGLAFGLLIDITHSKLKFMPFAIENKSNAITDVININMVKDAISKIYDIDTITKEEFVLNTADNLYEIVCDYLIVNDLIMDTRYTFMGIITKEEGIKVMNNILENNIEYKNLLDKKYNDVLENNKMLYNMKKQITNAYETPNYNTDILNGINNFYKE